jgi:hypothetical protein
MVTIIFQIVNVLINFVTTYVWKPPPPRRYAYFDVVVGLVCSHDPKSYAGYPMPDRSRVMTQTKRDILVLQVGGLAWG